MRSIYGGACTGLARKPSYISVYSSDLYPSLTYHRYHGSDLRFVEAREYLLCVHILKRKKMLVLPKSAPSPAVRRPHKHL